MGAEENLGSAKRILHCKVLGTQSGLEGVVHSSNPNGN